MFPGAGQLEVLLVRLLFCLFADDTGIFERRNQFKDYLETRTSEDGLDLGQHLASRVPCVVGLRVATATQRGCP